MKVPVVDSNQVPLMPTTKHRAMRMVAKREATPFWKNGVWCIRLNKESSARHYQDIAVGIDPGSKREGFTVKSEAGTILNIQADAVTHVSDRVTMRREMRRGRRHRNTPCRKNRGNRSRGGLPPSTRARWQFKINMVKQLQELIPITDIVVEDIAAKSWKNARKWNSMFSPLEVGKEWAYDEFRGLGRLYVKKGWETAEIRNSLGLRKNKNKMAETWDAHCVDSWCLAYSVIGGEPAPDDLQILRIRPIQLHRRQLHRFQPAKGGVRKPYGGTRSLGFKRGSLVKHPKYGLTYVGGAMGDRISLHDVATGKRLCQNAKPADLRCLAHNSWQIRLLPVQEHSIYKKGHTLLPALKDGVSEREN